MTKILNILQRLVCRIFGHRPSTKNVDTFYFRSVRINHPDGAIWVSQRIFTCRCCGSEFARDLPISADENDRHREG